MIDTRSTAFPNRLSRNSPGYRAAPQKGRLFRHIAKPPQNMRSHTRTDDRQLTGKEYTELLQGEGANIAKARAEGLVQDFFVKADRGGLVTEPKQAANNILPTKPMDGGVMAAATNQVVAGADLRADLARGAFSGPWSLVPSASSVRLKAKAMWGIVPVKGTFSELAGSAAVAADGGVTGRLEVKSASINTKMKKRDEHLRSDDFFASDRFSDIVFEIDQVTSTTSGLTVEGRLTVRERTIRLEFPVVVTELGSGQMGIDTELDVDRSELGLSYRGKGATKMNNALIIHAVFARP